MCLILIAWRTHHDFPLIVAANRDEFFARPTEVAHWWLDAPGLLAGRDRLRGGSWLGVTRNGRFAAVTNFREPPSGPKAPRSRGELVGDYLRGAEPAAAYLARAATRRVEYDGYNLFAADAEQLHFLGRSEAGPRLLAPGLHALSNGDLDAPWPKVVRARQTAQAILERSADIELRNPGDPAMSAADVPASPRAEYLIKGLLALLADRAPAADGQLPDTGVGRELERALSPIFVHMDGYGTRSSSVLLRDHSGRVRFVERSFDEGGNPAREVRQDFTAA